MRSSLFSILLILLSSSCEEKLAPCDGLIVEQKQLLENSFKSLHSSSISEADLENFKNQLTFYIENVPDKKCLIGQKEFYGHQEVKELHSQIKFGNQLSIKVVYGNDDRQETGEHTNDLYNRLAKSVAAQIPIDSIGEKGELLAPTLGEYFNLCSYERFREQLSAASCSGFLVDKDLLVTAGHCMTSLRDCNENFWVFDYLDETTNVSGGQVYACKEIVSQQLDSNGLDYAVIRLNRVVEGRRPLKFRTQGEIENNASLVVIGHPSGLPQKIADGAIVRDNSDEIFFSANLDTFGGNSGSPVFNAQNGKVEGILVRGDTDYVLTDEGGNTCNTINYCPDNGCGGEEVTRITLVEGLPDYKLLTFEDTFKTLFSNPNLAQRNSFIFPLNSRSYFNFAITGRRFLDACISHVVDDQNIEQWLDQAEFNCEDTASFANVYNSFVEIIEDN